MNSPARLLMIGPEHPREDAQTLTHRSTGIARALRRAGVRSYEEIACVLHEPGGVSACAAPRRSHRPQLLTDARLVPTDLAEFLAADETADDHRSDHRQAWRHGLAQLRGLHARFFLLITYMRPTSHDRTGIFLSARSELRTFMVVSCGVVVVRKGVAEGGSFGGLPVAA